jgi:beta-hydroxylase
MLATLFHLARRFKGIDASHPDAGYPAFGGNLSTFSHISADLHCQAVELDEESPQPHSRRFHPAHFCLAGHAFFLSDIAMKWFLVSVYVLSLLHVHFRGRVRMPFFRQMFDHSTFVAPVNFFMRLFSGVPTTPFLPVKDFPELKPLQDNWEVIRAEGVHLSEMQKIRAAAKNDDAGFNSFFKTGWKRFYLKWYDANHPSAEQLCPRTVAMLRAIPNVKAAMFAELPPGAKLNMHRDPFAGSLRYHLGLATPNDDRCFIEVDGTRYSWRDGEGVIFDETFIHWAKNDSASNRIILFCDIERPMRYGWAQRFNKWFGRTVMTAASSPNETGDQTGGINKMFRFVWVIGQYRRKFKNWNRPLYYVTKALLIVGTIALIIFA